VARIRVIGLGNDTAGDDAVGLLAADAVERLVRDEPDVEVSRAGDPLRALDHMEGADTVILVDAIRTADGMRTPGEVVRLDRELAEAAPGHQAVSSHGIGLRDVLGLAGLLTRVPTIVFWGIEIGRARTGDELSPGVAGALPELARDVADEARELAHAGAGTVQGR
jgi:hydrogenase maturation protease